MLEAIETVAAHERHVMTGTAMARFMRELFGERPEPWSELEAREDHDRPITVTSESLAGAHFVAPPLPTARTLDAHVFARDTLDERLHAATRAPSSAEHAGEAIGAVTRP